MLNVDPTTLRELRAHHENMVAYYGEADTKALQNTALKAAGLAPIHNERQIEWDRGCEAKHRRFVEAIDAVIAYAHGAPKAEAA